MDLAKLLSGVGSLRDRLPPLFAELIRSNLPKLEQKIVSVLQNAKDTLREIGDEPQSGDLMLHKCQSVLQNCLVSRLQEPIREHMTTFREEFKN